MFYCWYFAKTNATIWEHCERSSASTMRKPSYIRLEVLGIIRILDSFKARMVTPKMCNNVIVSKNVLVFDTQQLCLIQ